MEEKIDPYLIEKTLEQLKGKYFDGFASELKIFRDLPMENKIRIYFEYWFLLKKLKKERVSVKQYTDERERVGFSKKEFLLARVLEQISSNGCLNVFCLPISPGVYKDEANFEIDFNYFNKANPTYKVGKFSTEEIFAVLAEPDENKETIKKMYALVIFLNEQIKQKNENNFQK